MQGWHLKTTMQGVKNSKFEDGVLADMTTRGLPNHPNKYVGLDNKCLILLGIISIRYRRRD